VILFHDISQWQNNYDMNDGNPAIAIKMGGGDAGLYFDSKASANYYNAVQAGKIPMGYWFAGGNNPIDEAKKFLQAMSPLAENDLMILDWEIQHADPVGWCRDFTTYIHDQTGVWCWVYMNMSTANAYDWSSVFNNCGYWCAAPSFSFDATLPVKYPQIAQQGPIVNGVDTDAFFGTIEQLKAYGYHLQASPSPAPAPEAQPIVPVVPPTPDPTPVPAPQPVDPAIVEAPVIVPLPLPEPPVIAPLPPVAPPIFIHPVNESWFRKLIAFLMSVFGIKK